MSKLKNTDFQGYGSVLEHQKQQKHRSKKNQLFKKNYTPFPATKKTSSKDDVTNPNRHKLGTFSGCFIPTILNIVSILMFLRFGHIISLLGISGTFLILIISYVIDMLTTLSISAIVTNGVVPGGGVYVIICRSLGIEFGGGIGIVFFLGQILNSGMNCVGVYEPIFYNFKDILFKWFLIKDGFWFNSMLLFACFAVCMVGSGVVSQLGNLLASLLSLAIVSIPITSIFMKEKHIDDKLIFTGASWETFGLNFWPDWELLALNKTETINSLFGLFFCATAGIFSGAGMSSELRKPSKSIPKGTIYGLLVTFACYAVVILSMGSSIPRNVMFSDLQVVQKTNLFPFIIIIGELATSIFSIIVGLIGSGYVLDAISKDEILPGLKKIKLHEKKNLSLFIAYFLTQLCLFSDVNNIANFVTMSFLMTFIVTNLACFLLEVSAAPNFRPSFKWFNRYTCLLGGSLSILAMFVVDGFQALTIMSLLVILMLLIHYTVPPKFFGDVSQNLIYHQVRKYLLKIRINDNIKYWRPQILLVINNPKHEKNWRLMNFCNDLKKSGLYILGHIMVKPEDDDSLKIESDIFKEYDEEVFKWEKIRDMANLKAFIQVSIANSVQWGIRNLYLGSGLGGMKPNITIIGLIGENNMIRKDLKLELNDSGSLDCKEWVRVVEDLSLMKSNIAIAKGFESIYIPKKNLSNKINVKKYIDLYPIQMSNSKRTYNFDTYTLIMQLGALLKTVPHWNETHILRCVTFVEYEYERLDEYKKLNELLTILRIECEVMVLCLQDFDAYNGVVKGDPLNKKKIDEFLSDDPWWNELKNIRNTLHFTERRHSFNDDNNSNNKNTSNTTNTTNNNNKTAAKGINIGSSYKRLNSLNKYSVSLDYRLPIASDSSNNIMNLDLENSDATSVDNISVSSKATLQDYINKKFKPNNTDQNSINNSINPVFSSDKLPKTQVLEASSGQAPTLGFVDESNAARTEINTKHKKANMLLQPAISPRQNSVQTDYLNTLSFNMLPRNIQFLILNDIFLTISPESITNLIFTTLPLPEPNTFKDKTLSEKYVEDLNIWLMDDKVDYGKKMPAALLINSQSMTVTTAL
ncbi:hypothetical protein ACO0SA_001160 [Hanseniaspora valbyensis]